MTQAENFLNQFQKAGTAVERRQIADEYQLYFDKLTALEQQQARLVMEPLRADIHQTIAELDTLSKQIEQVLNGKALTSAK